MRVVAVAVLLLLAGCTGPMLASDDPPPSAPASTTTAPPLDTSKYVALGDSFTAAPLVPVTDLASGCFRSDRNYPSLLVKRLDVDEFVDVSCSGASTRDLTSRQHTFAGAVRPPQIRAVDADTTLVTVGIGGNDFGLYTRLVSTCLRVAEQLPEGAPCQDAEGPDAREETGRIGDRVEEVLERIQARAAADARVVLVGYPRIAPSEDGCPARLPFAVGDVAFADRVLRLLNRALARAAEQAGAEFVDLYAASRGHDVCSDEPWVNGARARQREAAAFHPYLRGMRGAAAAIADHLTETSPRPPAVRR